MKNHLVSWMLAVALVTGSCLPAAAQDGVGQRETLEVLGATAAIALYNSHAMVAMSRDALEANTMTETQTVRMLSEQRNMMKMLLPYLEKLLSTGSLEPSDAASVDLIRTCASNIVAMADALEQYTGTRSSKHDAVFQVRREASYATIARLLGLDRGAETAK